MAAQEGQRRRSNERQRTRGARPSAWDAAVKYLATRARTAHEVQQTLLRHGYPLDDIATVMARLTAVRYVDDVGFAQAWVAARARRGVAAPARLARELRAKGVSDSAIASAVRTLAGEWDANAAADEAAQRKMKALGGVPTGVARRRLAAYLERRGFGRDVVLATCRRWFSDKDDAD